MDFLLMRGQAVRRLKNYVTQTTIPFTKAEPLEVALGIIRTIGIPSLSGLRLITTRWD